MKPSVRAAPDAASSSFWPDLSSLFSNPASRAASPAPPRATPAAPPPPPPPPHDPALTAPPPPPDPPAPPPPLPPPPTSPRLAPTSPRLPPTSPRLAPTPPAPLQRASSTSSTRDAFPPAAPPRLVPGNVREAPPPPDDASPDASLCAAPRCAHSWARCPASAFHVRQPDYRRSSHKAPSAPMLYEVFAVDAFSTPRKLPHIGRAVALPPPAAPPAALPPYLIVHWMIPNYSRRLFGARTVDGPGWSLVWYCRLSAAAAAACELPSPPPAVALLRRFIHPTHGVRLRGERLKCIIGLADLDEPGFSMMTRQLVGRYNYKPFLSKTASTTYVVPGSYFEIDIDTHTWGNAAVNGLYTVKAKMSAMLLRAGLTIQAEEDDELPEQMLAGCYLTHLDPSRGATLDPELLALLQSPSDLSPLPVKRSSSRFSASDHEASPTTP
ncbi:hypothetical protein AB1Y20_013402 [Prymnesium parvum]|uniref:Protein ENHANCED DISEASE RESISTANCE 2 C-terminal domain-containing protein n=1 Tax=Prymnesium parvum TaxID=97485 RepID=A0AB34IGK5_PRYPA